VALEEIARLVGHSSTHVTETIHRHEIRPALTEGAVVMDKIFKSKTGESAGSPVGSQRSIRLCVPLASQEDRILPA
jgi:hypothetical protein